jgi:lauroyl/myristoyl acyltransferase
MPAGLKSALLYAIRLPGKAIAQAGDLIRVFEFLLLRPAAQYLPKSWAYGLADFSGWILSLTPAGARARRSMRAAFPAANERALAREWLGRPFRDYVTATRVADGRDNPNEWRIESRNQPAILNEPGKSVIVATAHVSRQSMTGLYLPGVTPKKIAVVIAELEPDAMQRARKMRVRMQLGEMIRGLTRLRNGAIEFIEVGAKSVATKLLHRLIRSETVLVLAVDAPWPRSKTGSYERPFAGHANHNVALGTARLARYAQCPIVICVSFLDTDGHIVVEWSDPIAPPAPDDAAAEVRITDLMLDTFENAIGRHPGQYVLAIGEDRYWDPKTERWCTRPSASQVRAPAKRPSNLTSSQASETLEA